MVAIPNGVNLPRATDTQRGDVILSVGEFEPRKRVPTLIDGHARYWKTAGGCACPGGCGRIRRGAVRRAAALNPGCDLQGFVGDSDLAAFYATARLAVTLSRYEGFGLPVLEAMAAGCPVMVADTPALVEVAADVGLVVDDVSVDGIARALAGALGNTADLAARGRRGRARAAEFTWDATAAAVLDHYRQALGGAR